MTATAKVRNTSHQVVLDGGGLVTLSGGGKRQILYMNTCDAKQKITTAGLLRPAVAAADRAEHHAEKRQLPGPAELRPPSSAAGAAAPCSTWAASSRWSTPGSSTTAATSQGPDLGGAAIRALAQYRNRPVYITRRHVLGRAVLERRRAQQHRRVLDGAQQRDDEQQGHRLRGEPGQRPGRRAAAAAAPFTPTGTSTRSPSRARSSAATTPARAAAPSSSSATTTPAG